MPSSTDILYENLDTHFLMPIPLSYQTPPSTPRRQLRSQSVDVGMIHAQISQHNHSLFNHLDKPSACSKSEPYCSVDSLVSNASSAKASFESNLDSIDENSSLKSFKQGSSSKRRCSDNAHLFSLIEPNYSPEKRQSEPMIRCAFYNKSFDMLCPKQPAKRMLSQNDMERKPLRRQISTIHEFLSDDAILDEDKDWRKLNLSAPKFQCCISDEDGRCVNYDPVYHNHETDLSEEELMRNVLAFEENFGERFERICPQQEPIDLDSIEEHGARQTEEDVHWRNWSESYCDDEVIYENVKVCRKCGHQTIKL